MLESASRCPFCDHAIVNHRAPLGGFLGVVLGVALVGCGADDAEDTSTSMGSTATMSTTDDTGSTSVDPSTTMTTDDSMTGSTSLTSSEATGPLYGPVTESTDSETVTDTDATSGTDTDGDTDGSTGGSTDSSGSGDTTAAESESVGPLYGPVTNGG